MNFPERLKFARKQVAKLSQKELEEKSGVKQQTISKIERGDQFDSTQVVELAIACGVRPEWLAIGEEPMVASSPSDIATAYATGSEMKRDMLMRVALLPEDGVAQLYPILRAFSAQYE